MRALVIGGSCPQIVLIDQLKKRGVFTILADNNINAVAHLFADEFVKADILDINAVKKIVIEKRIDFLIAVCADQVLLTVSKISEELQLPCYIDYETVCKVSDKGRMKKIFQQYGIPSSKYIFADKLNSAIISDMDYPLVVKPSDTYSAKGVRKAMNYGELQEFFEDALHISRSRKVIVEEYVEGDELTVDFQIVDGIAHFLCASNTEKVNYKDRFLAFRTRYPAAVSQQTVNRIKIMGQKIADAFKLKNTPMLIQLITDDKKESILEFSTHTGGGAKYLLIKMATGFDPITSVIDLTLEGRSVVGKIKSESNYITNEFLYSYPGYFDHLEGFEELKEEGIISEYWQLKWKGAEMVNALTSSDRVASITIQANTMEELIKKHNEAAKRMKVINTQGKDMMLHELLTDIKPF